MNSFHFLKILSYLILIYFVGFKMLPMPTLMHLVVLFNSAIHLTYQSTIPDSIHKYASSPIVKNLVIILKWLHLNQKKIKLSCSPYKVINYVDFTPCVYPFQQLHKFLNIVERYICDPPHVGKLVNTIR